MDLLSFISKLPIPTSNPTFTKGDMHEFLKYGSLGFLVLGLYKVGHHVANRSASDPLLDEQESLHHDAVLHSKFVELQTYRALNPWLFRLGMQNADHLLYLEHSLTTGALSPLRKDKNLAYAYFRMALARLTTFQQVIRTKLGPEHALVATVLLKTIFERLQVHFTNTLHACSMFSTDNLRRRAEEDIRVALNQ